MITTDNTAHRTLLLYYTAGLLLLVLNRCYSAPVTVLLDNLSRSPKRLPVSTIVFLAERSGEPPWSSLANPVLQLGLWAAMGSSSVVTARTRGARVRRIGFAGGGWTGLCFLFGKLICILLFFASLFIYGWHICLGRTVEQSFVDHGEDFSFKMTHFFFLHFAAFRSVLFCSIILFVSFLHYSCM